MTRQSSIQNVEKRNKHIKKKNCAPSWLYLQGYTGAHGQQNLKKSLPYVNTPRTANTLM